MGLGVVAAGIQPLRPAIVVGDSMEPTLHPGTVVIVDKNRRDPQAGEVVLINRGGRLMIKRVALVAGDAIAQIHSAGNWLVARNDYVLRRAIANDRSVRWVRVPKDYLYVVGDNLDHSEDSRAFGPIPREDVLGTLPFTAPNPIWRKLAGITFGPGRQVDEVLSPSLLARFERPVEP
jgi:signal peptidase I